MGTWTLHFDRTGLFDFLRWHKPARSATSAARAQPTPAATVERTVSRDVADRRGEAMRRFFPKLSAWFARQMYMAQMQEVERYLSQASNLCDLEQRIRRVERHGFVGPYV